MRTFILPLAALLAPLAACTVNGPREPAPEPSSPVEPSGAVFHRGAGHARAASFGHGHRDDPSAGHDSADRDHRVRRGSPVRHVELRRVRSAEVRAPALLREGRQLRRRGSRLSLPAAGGVHLVGHRPPQGAFKRSDRTLLLSVSDASQGPGAHPFPTTLTIDPSTGALAETGEGGAPCPYEPAGK